MKISEESKRELLELSQSVAFKKDMQKISSNRHNPFYSDSIFDADAYIEFLNQFNDFINHTPKHFRRIIDKFMKL